MCSQAAPAAPMTEDEELAMALAMSAEAEQPPYHATCPVAHALTLSGVSSPGCFSECSHGVPRTARLRSRSSCTPPLLVQSTCSRPGRCVPC